MSQYAIYHHVHDDVIRPYLFGGLDQLRTGGEPFVVNDAEILSLRS